MGEFNFGCAITGIAIDKGEKVLQVIINNPRLAELYELRQTLIMLRGSVKPTNDGTGYDDFLKFLQATREEEFAQDVTVRFGTYDGYGSLKEVDEHFDDKLPQFMIKDSVVKELIRFLHVDKKSIIDVLYNVLGFMNICRINPFYTLGGLQYFDETEDKFHSFRLFLIREELEKKSDELFEEDRL